MLDPNTVHELKDLLGDAYDGFMLEYIETSQGLIDKMDEHFNVGNMDDLRKVAHSLKSSSAQVGAETLSHIAKEIEISEGSVDKHMLQDIKAQFAAVKMAIKG